MTMSDVARRIESYLDKIKEADRDDQPGRVVQLEMTLAGIIRNEWPTIKLALSAAPEADMIERCAQRLLSHKNKSGDATARQWLQSLVDDVRSLIKTPASAEPQS